MKYRNWYAKRLKSSLAVEVGKQKKHYFAEAGKLRGQIRSMEKSIVRNVIDTADVICTTTTIDDDLLSDSEFDVVVIDEACQATAPGMWQALLRGKKIILAGDHQQLPPTVPDAEAASRGMQRSMMEEILEREGSSVFRRLTVQYRMPEIMDFLVSFFMTQECADPSVAHHKLTDHPTIESWISPRVLSCSSTPLEPILLSKLKKRRK